MMEVRRFDQKLRLFHQSAHAHQALGEWSFEEIKSLDVEPSSGGWGLVLKTRKGRSTLLFSAKEREEVDWARGLLLEAIRPRATSQPVVPMQPQLEGPSLAEDESLLDGDGASHPRM